MEGDEVSCINDFQFFAVTSISESYFFDNLVQGELGLGIDQPDNGPSIISALSTAGIINKQLVAVHIDTGLQSSDPLFNSRVTIGGYEPQFLDETGTFQTYAAAEKKWKIEVRGFEFMSQTIETHYKQYAIVDSFSRGIQIPYEDFREVEYKLKVLFGHNIDFGCEKFKCFFY